MPVPIGVVIGLVMLTLVLSVGLSIFFQIGKTTLSPNDMLAQFTKLTGMACSGGDDLILSGSTLSIPAMAAACMADSTCVSFQVHTTVAGTRAMSSTCGETDVHESADFDTYFKP